MKFLAILFSIISMVHKNVSEFRHRGVEYDQKEIKKQYIQVK